MISWRSLAGADMIYMERPQHNSDLTALRLAKDFNVPVWVDYDDLLHEIPTYNPSYKFYTTQQVISNVEEAMSVADVVTVSTVLLKEYYSKFNKNIHVVENAHNDYQYKFNKVTETVNAINWRGSATHRQDLLSVSENMWNVAAAHPQWKWTLIGNEVWYIKDKIDNCFHLDEVDTVDYHKFISDLASAIQINPLLDIPFNRAKSNISFIEGTYAGSATICPDMPEFQKPGAINYSDKKKDHFGYLLEKCMKSKEFRQKKYIESFEYVRENLLLSKINQKRLEIAEGLL